MRHITPLMSMSTMFQDITWCRHETRLCPSQCRLRYLSPYDMTKPQLKNCAMVKPESLHYPTLTREFQGFRVWGKFVFRTLELTDTPTNLANQVKVGHALDQSRSVQSRGPESAHQNNEPSWRSSRADRRLSRQFLNDWLVAFTF